MTTEPSRWQVIGWMFGTLNLIVIHPVLGHFYMILSLLYSPPAYAFLKERIGFSIPLAGSNGGQF